MEGLAELRKEIVDAIVGAGSQQFAAAGLSAHLSLANDLYVLVLFRSADSGVLFEADFHDQRVWLWFVPARSLPVGELGSWAPGKGEVLIGDFIKKVRRPTWRADFAAVRSPDPWRSDLVRAWLAKCVPVVVSYLPDLKSSSVA